MRAGVRRRASTVRPRASQPVPPGCVLRLGCGQGILHPAGTAGADPGGRGTRVDSSGGGKVLLAFRPESDQDRLLRRLLPAATPRTIVDPDALRRQLAEVRTVGFAQIQAELEEGLNAVAAPIRQ